MFKNHETRYYYNASVSFRMFFVQRLCPQESPGWKNFKKLFSGGMPISNLRVCGS